MFVIWMSSMFNFTLSTRLSVDASTMATSLETVKSWNDKRSIVVDFVLGCSDAATLYVTSHKNAFPLLPSAA